MNDQARLKFIERLGHRPDLTVSEAGFIDSLDECETLNDQQRQRIDDLHRRHGKKKATPVRRDSPRRFIQGDAAIAATLAPCPRCHSAPRFARDEHEINWKIGCICIGVDDADPERAALRWNLAARPSRETP